MGTFILLLIFRDLVCYSLAQTQLTQCLLSIRRTDLSSYICWICAYQFSQVGGWRKEGEEKRRKEQTICIFEEKSS